MSEWNGNFVEFAVGDEIRKVELDGKAGWAEDYTLGIIRVYDSKRTLVLRPADLRCLHIKTRRRQQ